MLRSANDRTDSESPSSQCTGLCVSAGVANTLFRTPYDLIGILGVVWTLRVPFSRRVARPMRTLRDEVSSSSADGWWAANKDRTGSFKPCANKDFT
jgi:hypothetical protein